MRATVRDPSNEKKLAFLRALPGAGERLTFHKADLLVPGSFDEVVKGAYATCAGLVLGAFVGQAWFDRPECLYIH